MELLGWALGVVLAWVDKVWWDFCFGEEIESIVLGCIN